MSIIKALLLDFDGTLVTKDMLSVVCGIVGKEEESIRLNQAFWEGKLSGLDALITRINFLHGVSVAQVKDKIRQNDYLMPGAQVFFDFLHQNKIITILNSGSIIPILEYYQEKLGIEYLVGTSPEMDGDLIDSISEANFSGPDFKLDGSKKILEKLGISPSETMAIGDSPADKVLFQYIQNQIAIDPKEGIEQYAKEVIYNDLSKAIPIIQKWNHTM